MSARVSALIIKSVFVCVCSHRESREAPDRKGARETKGKR